MKRNKRPRVAIVYDRVNTEYGGAEFLLTLIHQAIPEAPLFTSVWHARATWSEGWAVQPSWLQRLPFASRHHQFFFSLMPFAFESLDFSAYDCILSVSSAEAKGILTLPHQRHLAYLFTPTRHLHQVAQLRAGNSLLQTEWGWRLFQKATTWLRAWDLAASWRPDELFTLSARSARLIERIYQRSAQIIYPALPNLELAPLPDLAAYLQTQSFLLSLSRLVSYKRIDLLIKVAVQRGERVVIVGTGSAQSKLAQLYPSLTLKRGRSESCLDAFRRAVESEKLIVFLATVTERERVTLLRAARAVAMLGAEDFGLVALEAIVACRPVLLNAEAGASEVLASYPAAIRLPSPDLTTVAQALEASRGLKVSAEQASSLKRRFSPARFIEQIKEIVYDGVSYD